MDIITQAEILSTYPCIDGRRDWPEGAIYRYDRNGHELLRIVRGVDDELAAAVSREPVDLALIVEGPLVVICSRVGEALPWSGAPFHWHRVGRSDRVLPNTEYDGLAGSELDLMLLEGQGGRVRAARSRCQSASPWSSSRRSSNKPASATTPPRNVGPWPPWLTAARHRARSWAMRR
jgi:hypothetical protein